MLWKIVQATQPVTSDAQTAAFGSNQKITIWFVPVCLMNQLWKQSTTVCWCSLYYQVLWREMANLTTEFQFWQKLKSQLPSIKFTKKQWKAITKIQSFTESNPTSSKRQQAAYDCQFPTLGSERHLLMFPHHWILHAEQTHKQPNSQTWLFISKFNWWCVIHVAKVLHEFHTNNNKQLNSYH